MSDPRVFDQFPVELLHILFNYFSTSELIFRFHNINDYVNASLRSYSDYHLDCKSISKSHFRYICQYVRPEQVISLTLSDGHDTPGQSQVFFSGFQIEQFIRLRSLTLIEIEFNSLELIFTNLHKLDQLCALSFDDRFIRYQYSHNFTYVFSYLTNFNVGMLSQLNSLHLNSGTILTSIPLPNLRHLKLETCTSDELETIFQNLSQLKSLCVCLDLCKRDLVINIPSNQLIRLNLEITNNLCMILRGIKQFVLQFPHLKHLELILLGFNDMPSNYDWNIANSFMTFNFKFRLHMMQCEYIGPSFGIPFGLEGKGSFVAFQDRHLFSIPRFALDKIDLSEPPYYFTTAPDKTFLYNYVNKITMLTMEIKHNHYFTHIKTLELGRFISVKILESVIDLKQVEHLIIPSVTDLLIYMPLKNKMPQLNQLTVRDRLTIDMHRQIKRYQFKQILELEISVSHQYGYFLTEQLYRIFPYVKYLKDNNYIESEETMIHLIDGFKHLRNGSFSIKSSLFNHKSSFCQDTNKIIQHSQRLTQDNFTFRIYKSVDDRLVYNWWIDEDPSIHCERKYSVSRQESYWNRFKSFFNSFIH